MKTHVLIAFLGLLALNSIQVRAEAGGRFAISSPTFTPGGDTLQGGRFSLRAAIGQHDAGSLRGGDYSLEGGFLHGIRVEQSPRAPQLKIRLAGRGQAVLSWPVDAEGWILEETDALNHGKWKAVLAEVSDTATEHTVTVPAAGVMKCYRLRQP